MSEREKAEQEAEVIRFLRGGKASAFGFFTQEDFEAIDRLVERGAVLKTFGGVGGFMGIWEVELAP